MKRLWKFAIIGLLGVSLLSEAKAMVVPCPLSDLLNPTALRGTGLGRITCQSRSGTGKTSICFKCPAPAQTVLDQLCTTEQPEHCSTHRCSADFLKSCKKSCSVALNLPICKTPEGAAECRKLTGCTEHCDDPIQCDNNCEKLYKQNCTNCTARIMEGC